MYLIVLFQILIYFVGIGNSQARRQGNISLFKKHFVTKSFAL